MLKCPKCKEHVCTTKSSHDKGRWFVLHQSSCGNGRWFICTHGKVRWFIGSCGKDRWFVSMTDDTVLVPYKNIKILSVPWSIQYGMYCMDQGWYRAWPKFLLEEVTYKISQRVICQNTLPWVNPSSPVAEICSSISTPCHDKIIVSLQWKAISSCLWASSWNCVQYFLC